MYCVADVIRSMILCYRLSDFLFTAARYVANKEGREEVIYRKID